MNNNTLNPLNNNFFSFIICFIFLALFLPLNYWLSESGFWSSFNSWLPAKTSICEYQLDESAFRQPLNTISNIFFLFFSLEMFFFAKKDRSRKEEAPNMLVANYHYSLIYGSCFFLLFIFSTLYHASMLHFFQQLDMAGVYACVLFPFFYTIHKLIAATWYKNKTYYSYSGSLILIGTFMLMLYIFTTYFWQEEAYLVIGVLSLMNIFLTLYHLIYYVKKANTNLIIASLITSVIALAFYGLDSVYCYELSYMQLHSLWHIFAAFSSFYFYLFLRSERNLIVE